MPEKSTSLGNDFILFASKASRLMDSGKTEDALELCETGVRNFPFYVPGHYVLGLCYDALERKDDAKQEFERTLIYDPSHSKAMRKLSSFYIDSGLQQIANELLIKEALYNPLDQSLINILKEKNIYEQLNPSIPVEKKETDIKETVKEEQVDPVIPESPEAIDNLLDEVNLEDEPASNQKDVTNEEKVEQELIDNLDPLAGDIVPDDEQNDDFPDKEKAVDRDLNQFANMEDDFSTIMTGYFDKEEEKEQTLSDNEEWIEVENLLIDEEEIPTSILENFDDETSQESDLQNRRDETELLLEQLSDSETEDEVVEEQSNVVHEEEIILIPEEQIEAPPAVNDIKEPETSPSVEDIVPEPVAEIISANEQSSEEEVTIRDIMENPNLVTPTFGEILVSQHKFSEARHIFLELLKREPDSVRFLKKVEFLDKFLKTQNA